MRTESSHPEGVLPREKTQSLPTNSTRLGSDFNLQKVSHVCMDQSAMVYACLGIKYIQKDGLQGYKALGSYKPQWNKINHNLASEVDEIPDGSLVTFVADIPGVQNPELGVWYLLDKCAGRRVHLKLTGSAFKVWWTLERATMVDSIET